MMRYLKAIGGLLLASALVACGGGGGSAGTPNNATNNTGGSGGTTTTPAGNVAVAIVNSAGATVTTVDAAGGYQARATVTDASGQLQANKLVTFALADNTIATLGQTTGLTNAQGVAQVGIAPAPLTSGGAASVTASATLNTSTGTATVTGSADFAVAASQNPAKVTPAALEVFTSSPELTTAANSSISFNVTAKDANSQAIPNQTVTFSATSGSLVGALPAPATGSSGQPITSVSLSSGADRSNRTITVTVSAGTVTQKITVPVTGTTIGISGASFVLLNSSTTFTVKALDSAAQPIAGATLTATSALGNAISPSTLTTNSQGAVTFTYTGTKSGADTITVSGLGTSATAPITVSADQFSFESPASGTSIVVGAAQTVTVRYLINNLPQVGASVTFSTTRGSITPTTATTDATGRASASVTSSSSGPANIVAQTASGQVTLPVNFIATTPKTLVLQANPGSVHPNTNGSTTNQAALQATVRDAAGNPVSGVTVNFTAVTDPSNGSISPGTAVTDPSGTAVSQFIAGPIGTANNGVIVQGTVQGTSIAGTASLTVNAQALFIAINTGNEVTNVDPTTYQKQFSVAVTDATGAPSVGTQVTLSVYPDTYLKGTLTFDTNKGAWVYTTTPKSCPNEDVNRNGILDAGEDTNNNGKLDPGIPVVVSPSTVTTDGTGRALFTLQYGENFVPWLTTQLTARASVAGTESVKIQNYTPEGAASDFNSASNPPAGVRSPFGTVLDCTSAN
jgi:hypothetical protein